MQQARLEVAQSSAAYALATGTGVSMGESDFRCFESALDSSQRQSFSEVEQPVAGYVQKAFTSHGLSAEQAAQATRSISAGLHAGVSFDTGKTLWGGAAQSLTGLSGNAGASAEGRTATAVSESEKAQLATQVAAEAMSNDQRLTDYQRSRAESLSHARRVGTGQEWASTGTRQEGFTKQMQNVGGAAGAWHEKTQDTVRAGANVGGVELSRAPMETLAMGSGSELKADYAAKSQEIKIVNQEERQAICGIGEESVKGMTEVDHRKTALENMGFDGGDSETGKLLERVTK